MTNSSSALDGIQFGVGADCVARIVLDNGPGNKIGWAQLQRLETIIDDINEGDATNDVRCVLLSATGDNFCHGANLTDPELANRMGAGEAGRIEIAELGQAVTEAWDRCRVPTIVHAQGRIIGAGACLFFGSDFRYGDDNATVSFPEIDRGMHLSWGIIPILNRELGTAIARGLVLSGQTLAAVNVPNGYCSLPNASTAEIAAKELASKPPIAVQQILTVLRSNDATADAAKFATSVGSDDFATAMTAFFTKSTAEYRGQ